MRLCRRKATTFSKTARLIILSRGFPPPRPLWEKISLPATAAGGHHAKWERRTTKSQEELGYWAISRAGEDSRWKEGLSPEANRNCLIRSQTWRPPGKQHVCWCQT